MLKIFAVNGVTKIPLLFKKGHTQYPQKINACSEIIDNIIRLLFTNGNLNGKIYAENLEESV